MGLTLFWELELKQRGHSTPPTVSDDLLLFELPPAEPSACPAAAMDAIRLLRDRCLDLPFESVSELMRLQSEPRAPGLEADLWSDADSRAAENDGRRFHLAPIEVVGFSVWAGEQCETGSFFLARYPSTYWVGLRRERTGWPRWSGHGFCKTQYASLLGHAHFVRCHLAMIAALDAARRLGLLSDVSDEGHFWAQRDVNALTTEVDEWNAALAGLGGALKDALGDGAISGPIFTHPAFERLEATAVRDPKLNELFRKVRQIPAEPSAERARV